LRDHQAGDDALAFERAEPLGEHAITDIGNGATQLGIPHAPIEQKLNNRAGPPAPDELHGRVKSRAERALQCHAFIVTAWPT
jgi:hypothetical protein